MSSYSYKGININTITYTTGGTANTPYGSNFITVLAPAGQNLSLPLPLSYQINGTDISNICTAAYTDATNAGINISNTAPNAKSFRFVIVGGGGGGGGNGGNASAKNNTSGNTATGNGGSGGNGGYATYFNNNISNIPIVSGQNISVTIGNGGGAGGNGANKSVSGPGGQIPDLNTNADPGNAGGSGNITTVNYDGSSYNTNYVGNGGNGGGGASATLVATNGNVNSNKGGNGNAGNATSYSPPSQFPSLGNAGVGGVGATPGNGGACRIIWLYD